MDSHDSLDPQLRAPSSYNLNPIRLPPPLQNPGLPSLAHEGAGHPYYTLPQDHRSRAVNQPPPGLQNQQDVEIIKQTKQPDERNGDPKRPRACEACRGLKVRCEPDPVKGTCRRCAKAGRQCVVTVPSRKRQKKTDSRVAELEKKIDALTASLHATRNQSGTEDDSYDEDELQDASTVYQGGHSIQVENTLRKRKRPSYQDDQAETTGPDKQGAGRPRIGEEDANRGMFNSQHILRPYQAVRNSLVSPLTSIDPSLPGHEYADVIDRKILDAATAAHIFYHYTTHMAVHMPAVVFSSTITAGEIRRTKPILFLAILSVASGQDHPDIQRILLKEITRVYADSIICKGERSLELIQALQISSIWYWPEDHKDARPYQLINMAAVMAMAMGLGRRKRFGKGPFFGLWKGHAHSKASDIDTTAVESRRAWLSCYALSANFAMGLRQPNLFRWDSYIDECVEVIEKSIDAMPSDKVLCQWVKLQRLTDEISEQFGPEDLPLCAAERTKARQPVLKGFEERLHDWHNQIPDGVASLTLSLSYHSVYLIIYRVSVRFEHNFEDLEASRGQPSPSNPNNESTSVPNQSHIEASRIFLSSIHKVLESFLCFTAEDVRTIPIFHFVRVSYAVVFLLRLHCSAVALDSEDGRVVPAEEMKLDEYLTRLLNLLQVAASDGRSRPAQSFQLVIMMLKAWFERHQKGDWSKWTDKVDQDLKLHTQPVDVERDTPRLGYRKILIHTEKSGGSGSSTTNRKSLKVENQPRPQELEIQNHVQQTPPLMQNTQNMENTPLHLLSRVATSDPSAGVHNHLPANQNHEAWYPYPEQIAAPDTPPQMQIPYPDENPSYYPLQPNFPDPTGTYNTAYAGANPNTDLEQAIGMAFGGEGDFYEMLMDDGYLEAVQGVNGPFGADYGGVWDGGGQ